MTITFYAEDEVVGTTEFQLPPPHGVEVPLALSFPGVVRVTEVRIATTGMELYVESFSVYGLRASECVLRSVSEGQCVSCENGLMDGLESSTDCGGTCPTKCQRDETCNENGDCASGMCGSSRPAVRFRTMAFESRGITNPLPAPVSSRRLSGADTFTDALAAFNALSAPGQASGSYCARNFEVGYDMANQAACTGGRGRGSRTNIGFHYIMPFDVFRDQPTVFEFRMHADWGFGGFTCFGAEGSTKTNDQCTYHGGDIWGHIYFSETISQIGSYEWEAVGFEGCCDGWQKLEVSLPNSCGGASAGWQLVNTDTSYDCAITRSALDFEDLQYQSRATTNPLPGLGSGRLSESDTFAAALAAFNSLDVSGQYPAGAYCERTFSEAYDMANQGACSHSAARASNVNIGFHYKLPFSVLQSGEYQFRMHADWGFGGFTCFGAEGSTKTNDQCTYHGGDIWGHIYFSETISQIGSYEWEAVGFEGCCDGWQKLEVSLPDSCGAGSGWQLVASAADYGCPVDACYDPSPISTCNDGVQNYIETDVDCGGASCATIGKLCAAGQSCG